MKVSFTGTRIGMSKTQERLFTEFLTKYKDEIELFAHGSCCGCDEEAHDLVKKILGNGVFITVFPSTSKTRKILSGANYVATPKIPMDRNIDIVKAGSDLLIACPRSDKEILRSGTWATVRIARKLKIPVVILQRTAQMDIEYEPRYKWRSRHVPPSLS